MRKRYVLTMTAANRVGILAAVGNAVADLGGSFVEIRQTVLQGFFTMIIAVDFPADREPDLVLEHVESSCQRFGVVITLKDPETESLTTSVLDGTECWRLNLEGDDEPGAMRMLAKFLAGNGIDITDLHAARSEESNAFRAAMYLSVPPVVEVDTFQPQLQAVCENYGLVATLSQEGLAPSGNNPPIRLVFENEAAAKPR